MLSTVLNQMVVMLVEDMRLNAVTSCVDLTDQVCRDAESASVRAAQEGIKTLFVITLSNKQVTLMCLSQKVMNISV